MKHYERIRAVRLSNRQYGQLRSLDAARADTLNIDTISGWNQTTLGGCVRREFVTESPDKRGVKLTEKGKQALEAFESDDFMRQVSSMKFSQFLNLDVYDETKRKRAGKALTVVGRKSNAA